MFTCVTTHEEVKDGMLHLTLERTGFHDKYEICVPEQLYASIVTAFADEYPIVEKTDSEYINYILRLHEDDEEYTALIRACKDFPITLITNEILEEIKFLIKQETQANTFYFN